jgi:hypothetical protein
VPIRRRDILPLTAVLLTTVLLTGGLAACGSDGSGPGSTPAAGDAAAPPPVVGFRFRAGTFLPGLARVRASAGRVKVLIVSEDGRPHAVQVRGRGVDTRITVGPGDATGRVLSGARPGRLRVVPDGATEPAVLIVG